MAIGGLLDHRNAFVYRSIHARHSVGYGLEGLGLRDGSLQLPSGYVHQVVPSE